MTGMKDKLLSLFHGWDAVLYYLTFSLLIISVIIHTLAPHIHHTYYIHTTHIISINI